MVDTQTQKHILRLLLIHLNERGKEFTSEKPTVVGDFHIWVRDYRSIHGSFLVELRSTDNIKYPVTISYVSYFKTLKGAFLQMIEMLSTPNSPFVYKKDNGYRR